MTTVTQSEAREALKTRNLWLEQTGNAKEIENYKPKEPFFHQSLTLNAAQVNQWRTEGYFPCVSECTSIDLKEYLSKIKKGDTIFQAKKISEYRFIVDMAEISPDQKSLFVICSEPEENIKPHIFLKITIEGKMFVHTFQGYFDENGPKRDLELAMGREWTGGSIIDDNC